MLRSNRWNYERSRCWSELTLRRSSSACRPVGPMDVRPMQPTDLFTVCSCTACLAHSAPSRPHHRTTPVEIALKPIIAWINIPWIVTIFRKCQINNSNFYSLLEQQWRTRCCSSSSNFCGRGCRARGPCPEDVKMHNIKPRTALVKSSGIAEAEDSPSPRVRLFSKYACHELHNYTAASVR